MSLTTVFIYFCVSGEFIASGFFIKYSLRGPFLATSFFVGFFKGDAFGFFEGEIFFPFKKKSCIKTLNILQKLFIPTLSIILVIEQFGLRRNRTLKKNPGNSCQIRLQNKYLKIPENFTIFLESTHQMHDTKKPARSLNIFLHIPAFSSQK